MCRGSRGLVLRFAIHSDEDNGSKHEEKPHKYGHHRTEFYVAETEQILCPWMLQFQSVFISFSVLCVFFQFFPSPASTLQTNKKWIQITINWTLRERKNSYGRTYVSAVAAIAGCRIPSTSSLTSNVAQSIWFCICYLRMHFSLPPPLLNLFDSMNNAWKKCFLSIMKGFVTATENIFWHRREHGSEARLH